VFARKLRVEYVPDGGAAQPSPVAQPCPVRLPCPVKWIDNFAMRNFTNSAVFDDTLPAGDGLLEAGFRVPLAELEAAMDDWFHRKGYLKPEERLVVTEQVAPRAACSTPPAESPPG
jgi:hypothetical protein